MFPAARRQIVLLWSAADAEARMYVDGRLGDSELHVDDAGDPAVLNWDAPLTGCSCCVMSTNRLGLGDEYDTDDDPRHWLGTVHRVAIYDRALTDEEIRCHYDSRDEWLP